MSIKKERRKRINNMKTKTKTSIMKPIRLKIFSSFTTSQNCKDVYERLGESKLKEYYGSGKDIYITLDDNEYTHVLILNVAMPQLRDGIPKSNVIGIAFEPPEYLGINQAFIQYAKDNISKYYIGSKMNLPHPFIEGKSYMWYLTPLTYIPMKNKHMSIMVSFKRDSQGHQYRHTLVENILNSPLPIDIYGNGCRYYTNRVDDRIKGDFKELEPYEDYEFHVAIENFQHPHYYSEKVMNPLLCNTTPVYLGCSSIDTYFPNMVISLTGNLRRDMELLYNIIIRPEEYRKVPDVAQVKQTINLLHNLPSLYSE